MSNRVHKLNSGRGLTQSIDFHVLGVLSYMAYHHEIEMVKVLSDIKRDASSIAKVAKLIAESPLRFYEFYDKSGERWMPFSSINNFNWFEKNGESIYPTLSQKNNEFHCEKLKSQCEVWCRSVMFFGIEGLKNAS